MADRSPLSNDRITSELESIEGWSYEGDALHRTFEFKDFRAAVSFIVRMAFFAEELNHHPEVRNVYNRVELSLTTHDAGNKVTELDLKLARAINDFSWV
jgi:4a-hydroxytetrahydrobiopterin dehydratase